MTQLTTGSRRVLIVDDDALVRSSLSRLIASWGHEVRSAGDGDEAVTLAKAFAPHVVFCDLGLPRHHGYEVAELITVSAVQPPVLVAISGYVPEGERAERSGFSRFLTKPPRSEDLKDVLASAAHLP